MPDVTKTVGAVNDAPVTTPEQRTDKAYNMMNRGMDTAYVTPRNVTAAARSFGLDPGAGVKAQQVTPGDITKAMSVGGRPLGMASLSASASK